MLLGCIGDDFTGSSDLANTLAKNGMHAVQYTGVPSMPADAAVQAGVVALKSRTIPADQAIRQSLDALAWLQDQGCQQFFFKYCSTFDSTDAGNIGPVSEALMDALGADRAIFCPAFPTTGRTIFQGHLFVGDVPLHESGMANHPLTPMTDSDLRRVLQKQCKRKVGHISHGLLTAGFDRARGAMAQAVAAGTSLFVVDAVADDDLFEIGEAVFDHKLVTGGSGVAMGLPKNFGLTPGTVAWIGQPGRAAALSGSCSNATRAQIAHHSDRHPTQRIDVDALMAGELSAASLTDWALAQGDQTIPLIYSSAEPSEVAQMQAKYGQHQVASAVEGLFAQIAQQLTDQGVTKLITAGGETSGAIVEALDLGSLTIGPEIDPGVPALRAREDLVVALKSGNFGRESFFITAANALAGEG